MPEQMLHMIDCHHEDVEIRIAKDGEGFKVWVNVNGVCRLRAYKSSLVIHALGRDMDQVWKEED